MGFILDTNSVIFYRDLKYFSTILMLGFVMLTLKLVVIFKFVDTVNDLILVVKSKEVPIRVVLGELNYLL